MEKFIIKFTYIPGLEELLVVYPLGPVPRATLFFFNVFLNLFFPTLFFSNFFPVFFVFPPNFFLKFSRIIPRLFDWVPILLLNSHANRIEPESCSRAGWIRKKIEKNVKFPKVTVRVDSGCLRVVLGGSGAKAPPLAVRPLFLRSYQRYTNWPETIYVTTEVNTLQVDG